jgi:hypothetical protein
VFEDFNTVLIGSVWGCVAMIVIVLTGYRMRKERQIINAAK